MTEDLALSMLQAEWVVSSTKGGAIAGSLLGGALMTSKGRRAAVALASAPFVCGPVLCGLSTTFAQALVGRLLMGLGIGIASVAAPCFLSEVAPPAVRGALVTLYEVAVGVGFLLAVVLDLAIQEVGHLPGGAWRYQAGLVPAAAALPLLLATALVPESPRWLIKESRMRRALEAMQWLHREGAAERLRAADAAARGRAAGAPPAELPPEPAPVADGDDLVALWDREHAAAGLPLFRPAEQAEAAPPGPSTLHAFRATLGDILAVAAGAKEAPPGSSRGLALAALAAVLNQACASTSVLVYAQRMLGDVGVVAPGTQDTMAVAVACAKLAGILAGLLVVNRVGRRPLLGWGGALCAAAMVLMAAGGAHSDALMLLLGMCSFIFVFCSTSGIGYWVVATEVTAAGGQRYGGASQAAATALLFAAGWASDLTFVSFSAACGPWALTAYAGVCVLLVLYALGLLPEMRGCTLEECELRVMTLPIEGFMRQRAARCARGTSGCEGQDGQV